MKEKPRLFEARMKKIEEFRKNARKPHKTHKIWATVKEMRPKLLLFRTKITSLYTIINQNTPLVLYVLRIRLSCLVSRPKQMSTSIFNPATTW